MPGLVLSIATAMTCFHGSKVNIAPSGARVFVSGQPVATASNLLTVAPGCPFQIPFGVGTKPQPCVRVQWSMMSVRVRVNQQPLLLQAAPPVGPGAGACISADQIAQGTPWITAIQTRVVAS